MQVYNLTYLQQKDVIEKPCALDETHVTNLHLQILTEIL
jgi:hypothetical protein